ncbi:MAG: hypothetical protein P8J86_05625 [Phycisphaerales bacterium]|nr:hypothetical protein [Phycisphaerales bacterium]
MNEPQSNRIPGTWHPAAAVLAWLWPGAGHMARGEQQRGWLIMAGVVFLVATGLFVGGLGVVDSESQRLWFLAQILATPALFGVNFAQVAIMQSWPAEELHMQLGIGRVHELGILFVAMAGLMNLVAILDVLYDLPRETDRRKEPSEQQS